MLPFDRFPFCMARGRTLLCAAIFLTGCAVYDDSLLQPSAAAAGNQGVAGAGSVIPGAGGASGITVGSGDRTGDGAQTSGGTNSVAGTNDAGAGAAGSSGGSGWSGAGTAGSASPTEAGGASGAHEAGNGGAVVTDAGSDASPLVEELVDDMEDGNNFIPAVDGRRGTWSVANDGTAGSEQTPGNPFFMTAIPNGRGASMRAAHTAGHGFTGWGAVLLVTLNQLNDNPKQSYDASSCIGITFWAKVGADSASTYKIRIADMSTLPEGKVCSGITCNDHHEVLATWSTSWTKYTYYFTDMRQEGWGVPQKPFDDAHIYDIEFQTAEAKPFDFWIDDLAFIKR
jgi:hypothetical protein